MCSHRRGGFKLRARRSLAFSNTPNADVSYRTVWRISNTHRRRDESGPNKHGTRWGRLLLAPLSPLSGKNVAIKKGFRRPFPSSSKDGLSSRRPFSPSSARPIAWVLDCFFGWRSSQTLSSRAIVSALEEPEEKKSGNTSSQHLRRPGNKLISN